MVKILLLLGFYFLSSWCEGAVFITKITENSAYPNQCWNIESKSPVHPGQTIQITEYCGEMTCGSDLRFYARTCGVMVVDDDCKVIPEDLSKPYPQCCAEADCTN